MIGVVGAGMTGLTLAYELRKRGRSVRVWEAEDRPGGVLWSEEVAGRVLDFGPQRTRLTRDVKSLIDGLDLSERLLYAPSGLPLYVYRSGRLRPVPFSRPGPANGSAVLARQAARSDRALRRAPPGGGERRGSLRPELRA